MIYLEQECDFNKYINEDLVLVDFYTDWCGPCKMLSEILEDVDFIKIIKVNADKFPSISMKLGLMSVPTLCFYKKGELVLKEVGFKTLDELKKLYESVR